MLRSEEVQSVKGLKTFNDRLKSTLCFGYIAHSDIKRIMNDKDIKPDDVGGWLARNSQDQIVVCHGLAYAELNPWKDVTAVGRIMEVQGMACVQQLKDFVTLNDIVPELWKSSLNTPLVPY